MKKATLIRVAMRPDVTFGVFMFEGKPLCVTLEDPWKNNQRNISCIPTGVYKCVPHNGAKYKGVWRLENVPNRAAILIHAGNSTSDTEGCILVGSEYGERLILRSQAALDKLRKELPDTFILTVMEAHT
jgi:hypothetical protein